MDTQQIPVNIATIIAIKEQEMKNEELAKEQRAEKEKLERIEEGRKKLRTHIDLMLERVPEWLRPFEATFGSVDHEYLETIGRGWGNVQALQIRFLIPGLAPIAYTGDLWSVAIARYSVDTCPEWGFLPGSRIDPETALVIAAKHQREFQQALEQHEAWKKSNYEVYLCEQESDENIIRGDLPEAQEALQQEAERDETQALFAEIKDDPLAVLMIKLYLGIQQERRMYDQLLEEADEALASVRMRNLSNAEDMRRRVVDMERRLEEERSRANDLENDLAKANKAQRANRGW
jgi:hypothetical protein